MNGRKTTINVDLFWNQLFSFFHEPPDPLFDRIANGSELV
jgi:hypothetical protein